MPLSVDTLLKNRYRILGLVALAVIMGTIIFLAGGRGSGNRAGVTTTPARTGQPTAITPVVAAGETPTPAATMELLSATPTVPQQPIAPLVLQTVPEQGAEQPLDVPLEITFDQPMDPASVEKAFAIEPGDRVDGTFEWTENNQTVGFKLNTGFERGQRYRVRIVESAQSQAGLALQRPFELRFSTVGFLEVANTQPATGTTEIPAETTVTVFFNRPVAPLGAIGSGGGSLPDPLTFVPPVTGAGEWLNTATYQFTPASPGFEPATEYTARISQGLTDVTGQAMLEENFEWSFTTISPAVVGSTPTDGDLYVSPTPVISVTFNQQMDRQRVEENLLLLQDDTGQPVPGEFAWVEVGMRPPPPLDEYGNIIYEYDALGMPIEPELAPVGVETVRFTPDEPLELGANYQIVLPQGVEGVLDQATTQAEYQANFTITSYPAIVSTNPADGEQFADMWQGLDITFNAPMNPASFVLGQNFVISPAISATEVYSYWSQNDTQVSLNFPRRENSEYSVTLGDGIEGRYGHPLDPPLTINWKTLKQSPYVFLVSPSIALYNGYQAETYVYMTVRNVSQVNFSLYRLSKDEFFQLSEPVYAGWDDYSQWENFQPDSNKLIGAWTQTTDPALYENYVYKVDVSQAVMRGQPLPPGLYYLEAAAPAENIYPEAQSADPSQSRDRQVLIVSKRNITIKRGQGDALAWLTDLQIGQPVANSPLTVLANRQEVSQTQTDQDGIATFTYEQLPNDSPPALVVFSGDPDAPDDNFAAGNSTWNAGIRTYDFDIYGQSFAGFRYSGLYNGFIYPDRPLYRPGQTIYFKGMLRADDDAHYSLPTTVPTATVQIFDGQYREIYREDLPLSEWGTLTGSLQLGDNAGLGNYSLQMTYESYTFYGNLQVAAYRKPEFLVDVLTDKTEYRQGESIKVTAETEFFAGGPVSNAQVRWTLLSVPYTFPYQGSGYYDFVDTDELNRRPEQYIYMGFDERIANGEGVTDAEGRFTFEVPADIADRLASQTFTFDVAVIDINDQEVATQAKVVVHKGDFYVGLRPERYVGQVGADNPIELLVVDWRDSGQPVPNQEVEVVAAEYNFYSVQQLDPAGSPNSPDETYAWENIVENVAVFTTTVTTGPDGQAVVNFTPEKAGNYKIYTRAVDARGQEIRSATFVWVSGSQYVNWGQENNDRIELVTDQRQYNVGDTANILIPHPFSGTVTALVTLERGHVYQHFLTELTTNSDQLQIPITEDLIPNIYVSVMIIKGMDAPAVNGGDQQAVPGFRVGYVRLPVRPVEKELKITLVPTPPAAGETYQPGDTVEYQVSVTDVAGQPVKANLSLALIDKAVLTLAPDRPGQLLDAFWFERALGVETSSGLTLALDRINRSLDEKKGGGGGDGGGGSESVRQNFADNALWVADFVTDEQGQGRVEATLPDNLTTWVLIGKGITGADTLVGESRVEIVSSKPLLVRPVTPRFFVVGDELRVGMVIQNNSDRLQEVTPAFEAEGLTITPVTATSAPLKIEAGERVRVDYNVTVEDVQVAQLTMGARSAELGDALAFELPIYHLSTPETVATVGVLAEAGARVEGIALPRSFDPDRGALSIAVDPSLAAGMRAGLTYLEHFPYECVEQTVSRFLPNIFTYRAYQNLNLENPELAQNLPGLVSTGLQRLYSQQHLDGGWGWWNQDASDPFVTAYVLLGLVEARRAGLAVDQSVMDTAVAYLDANLVAPKDIAEPWQGNRQAFSLYVLAEAGSSDFSRAVALFERRELLDIFGRSYLAMAMDLGDPQAGQIETLLADITDAAIVSGTGAHWEEQTVDYYAMNTDTRSTAIVVAALARLQPDHPMLPQAVRWLMNVREQGGHWETTQETAWAIIGLTDWLVASGELAAEYSWTVSLNARELGQGAVAASNLEETTRLQVAVADLVTGEVNRLAVERDPAGSGAEKAGNLYYAAYLTYYKPVQEVKALQRGIVVSRQYFRQPVTPSPTLPLAGGGGSETPPPSEGEGRGEGRPISEAKVGDFIRVKLTLVAPTDLHYVLIEDPFPAGMEGVDTSLATTSVVGQIPTDPEAGEKGHNWWYFSHTELRDEKAVLFANYLPKGVYEYTYTLRASIPGEFRVIPTHAEQMYFPEVFGRSDGGVFKVTTDR